jgi:hypothetical protein
MSDWVNVQGEVDVRSFTSFVRQCTSFGKIRREKKALFYAIRRAVFVVHR